MDDVTDGIDMRDVGLLVGDTKFAVRFDNKTGSIREKSSGVGISSSGKHHSVKLFPLLDALERKRNSKTTISRSLDL